jgi:hypothetical protein
MPSVFEMREVGTDRLLGTVTCVDDVGHGSLLLRLKHGEVQFAPVPRPCAPAAAPACAPPVSKRGRPRA